MRKEDVKVGTMVREIATGDEGIVIDISNQILVRWTKTQNDILKGRELWINVKDIETILSDDEVSSLEDRGSFKINQKVKKVVTEIKEAESFTITLSLEAAHQLRALMGACTSNSALQKETGELCDYLCRKECDGLLTFKGTNLLIDFSKAKKWTEVH